MGVDRSAHLSLHQVAFPAVRAGPLSRPWLGSLVCPCAWPAHPLCDIGALLGPPRSALHCSSTKQGRAVYPLLTVYWVSVVHCSVYWVVQAGGGRGQARQVATHPSQQHSPWSGQSVSVVPGLQQVLVRFPQSCLASTTGQPCLALSVQCVVVWPDLVMSRLGDRQSEEREYSGETGGAAHLWSTSSSNITTARHRSYNSGGNFTASNRWAGTQTDSFTMFAFLKVEILRSDI